MLRRSLFLLAVIGFPLGVINGAAQIPSHLPQGRLRQLPVAGATYRAAGEQLPQELFDQMIHVGLQPRGREQYTDKYMLFFDALTKQARENGIDGSQVNDSDLARFERMMADLLKRGIHQELSELWLQLTAHRAEGATQQQARAILAPLAWCHKAGLFSLRTSLQTGSSTEVDAPTQRIALCAATTMLNCGLHEASKISIEQRLALAQDLFRASQVGDEQRDTIKRISDDVECAIRVGEERRARSRHARGARDESMTSPAAPWSPIMVGTAVVSYLTGVQAVVSVGMCPDGTQVLFLPQPGFASGYASTPPDGAGGGGSQVVAYHGGMHAEHQGMEWRGNA